MISEDLANHYSSHKVKGIQDYILGRKEDTDNHDRNSSSKRYIRLNPRFNEEETLDELRKELARQMCSINNNNIDNNINSGEINNSDNDVVTKVLWINERLKFYSIPDCFKLSKSTLYKSGRIYGMDVTSGAVVDALLLQDDDDDERPLKVLDLCCAPGNKTCAIFDILSFYRKSGSRIIGIDNSLHRLNTCKSIITKYCIDPCCISTFSQEQQGEIPVHLQLHCADVTTITTIFDEVHNNVENNNTTTTSLIFDSKIAFHLSNNAGARKRMNKSAKARQKSMLRDAANNIISNTIPSDDNNLFDRVLVDAECSTDGAIRHIVRSTNSISNNNNNLIQNNKLTNVDKLQELLQLQRKLIQYGFSYLKPGGIMVYSTCSLDEQQNESIVSWLLNNNSTASNTAYLIPLDHTCFSTNNQIAYSNVLPGCIRFIPNFKDTMNGMFIAKIGKKEATFQ